MSDPASTSSAQDVEPATDRSAKSPLFWMAILAVEQSVVVALSTWLQRSSAPILYADETGYLGAAVELSSRNASPFLAHLASYSVGYSAILAIPMSIFGGDPWRIAVAVNIIAVIALPVVAFNLITRISNLTGIEAAAAAAAAGAYPAVVLHVTRAWPEAIIPVLIIFWATALHSGLRNSSAKMYAIIATLASLLYVIHHRTVSVAGATAVLMIAAIVTGTNRREAKRVAVGFVGLLVMIVGLLLGRALEQHIATTIYLDHKFDRATYVLNGFRPHGWLWSGRVMLGQVWYLLVASLGIVGVAAFRIIGCIRHPCKLRSWILLVSLACVGTLAVGSAAIGAGYLRAVGPSSRADTFVYGRYIEIFIPLLIVIAFSATQAPGHDDMLRRLRGSIPLISVLTIAIIVIRGSDAFTANYQKVNLYGILGFEMFEGHLGTPVRPRLDIAIISLAGIAACAAVLGAARRSSVLAALTIWTVFVGLSFSAAAWTLRPWLNIFEQSSAAAAPLVEEAGRVAAVVDGAGAVRIESLTSLLYRAGYPPVEVVVPGQCPEAELVIAGDAWLPTYQAESIVDLVPFGGRLYRVACDP